MNAKNFSTQIVCIGGRLLGVPGRAARTFVKGSEAVGLERIGVVADGYEEATVGAESE
jgi:hypothetical protein